ncbi:helix-turn-helix domain-containing protein [Bartonella vinsonii]|uniref:helix-turn-helix domain-containing protein n=1 Tax=Bartonella vinsonii TaxID=33047 RepID=UPI00034C4E5E|nr:helix-turn-helix domain-containing protein [Bartonella vinsonii]
MDRTKKIIGRRLTAQHLEYQKIAENVEYKPVSRNKLSKLAYRLSHIDLISGAESSVLSTLLEITPDKAFKKGGVPIIFKSNQDIGCMTRSPGRVSVLLSSLYDCGLIVIWDFGYFGRQHIDDNDRYTPSTRAIDLRLFIIRYYELKEKVDKKLKSVLS